jgi:oligosaccharide reducing-end xylanase
VESPPGLDPDMSSGSRLPATSSLLVALLCGCGTTIDSLGYDDVSQPGQTSLRPLAPRGPYPNAFRDVLGKTDAEISAKLESTFDQLFHGDADHTIYYTDTGASGQAYIKDILHGDIRTEGIGYGMIIAVELNKRTEFDALWSYAKNKLRQTNTANSGYFLSYCDVSATETGPCIDPFGHEQFVMALIFAHDRWKSNTGAINYAADAQDLLHVMRFKEDDNGGIVGGITNSFDAATMLAYDVPSVSAATYTRPSIEMPNYYELWAEATGDPFWTQAAAAARAFWHNAANVNTGLMPLRATLADAAPVAGSENFVSECYRTHLSLVLDRIWIGSDPWEVAEANKLLTFFYGKGFDTYYSSYSLDGSTALDNLHDPPLIAVNGATALIATMDQRTAFIQATWDLPVAIYNPRYYTGLLHLLSLLILSGQYQVY